jgi:hypothetical protein
MYLYMVMSKKTHMISIVQYAHPRELYIYFIEMIFLIVQNIIFNIRL